jgi:hypothetical protein
VLDSQQLTRAKATPSRPLSPPPSLTLSLSLDPQGAAEECGPAGGDGGGGSGAPRKGLRGTLCGRADLGRLGPSRPALPSCLLLLPLAYFSTTLAARTLVVEKFCAPRLPGQAFRVRPIALYRDAGDFRTGPRPISIMLEETGPRSFSPALHFHCTHTRTHTKRERERERETSTRRGAFAVSNLNSLALMRHF